MSRRNRAGCAGFSLAELLVTLGLIAVASAAAVPTFTESIRQTRLTAATDLVSGQVRSARLAAVSRNGRVRLVFDCPVAGALRILVVTGDAAIDSAGDRCEASQPNDGAPLLLPAEVVFDAAPTLEFNGRGIMTAVGHSVPVQITLSHNYERRTLLVAATGRVTSVPQ